MMANQYPVQEDDSSIISERCWKEEHKGHSRKWLVRDGSTRASRGVTCSAMKESYILPEPEPADRKFKGIRRAHLEQKLMEEVAEEIINEGKQVAAAEEYCTEYDGNFNYPGYSPEEKKERDVELYLKYPLYTSQPVTYWKFNFDRQVRGQASMPGLTASVDVKNPFKKYSQFSKPLSDILDSDAL